jgi:hypothetical protein
MDVDHYQVTNPPEPSEAFKAREELLAQLGPVKRRVHECDGRGYIYASIAVDTDGAGAQELVSKMLVVAIAANGYLSVHTGRAASIGGGISAQIGISEDLP